MATAHTRKRGRPRLDDHQIEQKRQQIANAAIEIMREVGYAQMTLDEVAKKAGMTKPSLYSYISSKQELLYYVVVNAMSSGTETITRIIRQEAPVEERLTMALCAYTKLVLENSSLFHTLFTQETSLSDTHRKEIRTLQRNFMQLWIDLFEEGVREGKFRNIPSKIAVQLFVGVVNWIAMWHRTREGPDEVERIAGIFVEFCRKGIVAENNRDGGEGTA